MIEGLERITIHFPRGVKCPEGALRGLSEWVNTICQYDNESRGEKTLWVFGEGFAMSNPMIEPLHFDHSHYVIEVNEK